ncbi:uncharacterized protein [Onthophagus taurus]|uniref:uncharacterized protein isoform X1 n=1 Tax=Onthophagus taurus TaxID=166361 RepID=UPI0039BE92AA
MDEYKETCRRSSILKPRKVRNPLGDVEEHIIDNDKENVTITPKTRRVSFASNNQVKQFATDEEKNTIWDSTYEETADGSSQVSPPTVNTLHSITTSSKINVVYDENMDFTIPVSYVQERVEKSIINYEENLEFTKPIVGCLIQSQKSCTMSKESSCDETLDLTLPVGYNILEVKAVHENKTIICNDEITTDLTLPNNLNVSVNKNVNRTATNMSFTQAVGDYHNDDAIKLKNTLKNPSTSVFSAIVMGNKVDKERGLNQPEINMSFTQAVGGYHNEDLVNLENMLKNPLIQEKNPSTSEYSVVEVGNKVNKEKSLNQTEINMSFTQAVGDYCNEDIVDLENTLKNPSTSQFSVVAMGNKVDNEKSLNQTSNNMSFTQAVGSHSIDNALSLEISLKNCSIGEENQSESCLVTSGLKVNEQKSYNQNSTNDMSLTQDIDGINFECSLKNPLIVEDNQFESKSEFSRIAAGDLFPSFSKLKSMPLGEGLNPSEFEVSLSELKSVEHTQEPSLIDLTLENSVSTLNMDVDLSGKLERKIVEKKKLEILFDVKNFRKDVEKITKKSKKPDLTSFCDKLKKYLDLTRNYLKKYNENCKITANQSVESIISVDDSGLKIESIGTIIKSIEKDNKRFWKLLSTENNQLYKFSTLYGSIILDVTLKENSDEVVDLFIIDNLKNDVEMDAAYVHKVFINKLALNRIKAALGSKFDLRSLLDFVREKMLKQREFLQEFERLSRKYKLIMDENYRVIFHVFFPSRKIAWRFVICMCENDFQPDKNVTFSPLFPDIEGDLNINERKIEHFIKMSTSGILFIQDFIENVYSLFTSLK